MGMPKRTGRTAAGGSERSRFRTCACLLPLLAVLLGSVAASAQPAPRPPVPPAPEALDPPDETPAAARRESLLQEIRRYTLEIADLRDSLHVDDLRIDLNEAQRQRLEGSIDQFSGLVEDIGRELSRMDFQIADNRISLTDEAGEGIVIAIPPDLDARISTGIEALSKMILSELPDTAGFDIGAHWNWKGLAGRREPERRVVHGNVIKVWDDAMLPEDEDLRGDLVAILGDAQISGRVDGNVVVVMGRLELGERAEVTGKVVSVGGELDQAPGAKVGDLVVVDLWRGGQRPAAFGLDQGLVSFLVRQGLFLLFLMLAVVAVGVAPQQRLDRVLGVLKTRPGQSLGLGLVAAVVLQSSAAVLMAVLVLTVIGIPIALLLGLGLILLAVLAAGLASAVLGERLCRMVSGRCPATWQAMALGMVVLHSVSFLGGLVGLMGSAGIIGLLLTAFGWLIKSLVYFLGLGALVRSRFGTNGPLAGGE